MRYRRGMFDIADDNVATLVVGSQRGGFRQGHCVPGLRFIDAEVRGIRWRPGLDITSAGDEVAFRAAFERVGLKFVVVAGDVRGEQASLMCPVDVARVLVVPLAVYPSGGRRSGL